MDAGLAFVALSASYCGGVMVLILGYAVVQRTCREQLMMISAAISRLLARKNYELKAPLDIAILGFLATPAIVFAICIILGPLVGIAENWSAAEGIEYILGNTMGLTQPLTEKSPCTSIGTILAIAVSATGLLLVTLCLGIGQSLVSACRFWEFSASIASFLFWVFGFNLIMMASLCLFVGTLLSSVEGWDLSDGYKFAVSQICQFPNSLTNVVPRTSWGSFIEVLCVSLQVLVQSVALDTISTHPFTGQFIARLEAKGVRMRANANSNNGDATDRSAKEDVAVTESGWKQRVLELETKLKESELREAEYRKQADDLRLANTTLEHENVQLRSDNVLAAARAQPLAL